MKQLPPLSLFYRRNWSTEKIGNLSTVRQLRETIQFNRGLHLPPRFYFIWTLFSYKVSGIMTTPKWETTSATQLLWHNRVASSIIPMAAHAESSGFPKKLLKLTWNKIWCYSHLVHSSSKFHMNKQKVSGLLKHEKQPTLMALGGNVTPPLSLSNCRFRGVTEESA